MPVAATRFEDIIDGYFPLQESLRQMLVRNGFASACVTLTHVPIMDIPGLAPDAPVPLRLSQGTAGLADRLDIIAVLDGDAPQLSGAGKWRWYGDKRASEMRLSPLTRLAEPAIVQGVGLLAGDRQTQDFGKVTAQPKSDFAIFQDQRPNLQGLPDARFWAKAAGGTRIHRAAGQSHAGLFETQAHEFERSQVPHEDFSQPTEILMFNE